MTYPAPPSVAPQPPRRASRGLRSGVVTFVLLLVLAILPVPYLVQTPGPVFNTLGEYDGEDVLQISGTQTYPAEGNLDLLTVGVAGGPGRYMTMAEALAAWISNEDTVVPEETYYPIGTSRSQVTEANSVQMSSSQDLAVAAALTELERDYETRVGVETVVDGAAAAGVLDAGDIITAVNGEEITEPQQLVDAVEASTGAVTLSVDRDGTSRTVDVFPSEDAGERRLGVSVAQTFDFPIEVTFNLDGVGGPSAGMIFALTIVDELTPGNMTGGVPIAGTGEIDPEGTVSPIGGARQKVVAASEAGAEFFLSPQENCAEVLESVQTQGIDDMQVVRVDTLSDAREAVESIGSGTREGLPSCSS